MTHTLKLAEYGAVELNSLYPRNLIRATSIAALLVTTAVAAYRFGATVISDNVVDARPPIVIDVAFLPPSVKDFGALPAVRIAASTAVPSNGIPVPVPDASVNPENTIPTTDELRNAASPVDGLKDGTPIVDPLPPSVGEDGPPPIFRPVEKLPILVTRVEPKYPELALRTGIEGNVSVRMWVNKEGKVVQVVILKSDADLFNEEVIAAAKKWVFIPAIMNKAPVSVWTGTVFKFRIK